MEEDSTGPRRRRPTTPRKDSATAQKSDEASGKGETISEADAKRKIDFEKPLEEALGFMAKEKFAEAAQVLEKLLKPLSKEEKDNQCLHNLGVCYTELGAWAEAEEAFWDAFERCAKDDLNVFKTMYGLASTLTAQDDSCKLVQAEALLRDLLDKAMHQEGCVEDIYRSFVLLAENFGRQKKWADAAQCWESAVQMGINIFGEEHEMVSKHRLSLARAQKLGRWQGRLRIVSWTVCIGVPLLFAYFWHFRSATGDSETAPASEPQFPAGL